MTVLLDHAAIETATASGTANQKKAAVKALIGAALPADWVNAELDANVAANASAVTAKATIDTLVSNTYPVDFTL
jgi:uncharacterized protein YPO0396